MESSVVFVYKSCRGLNGREILLDPGSLFRGTYPFRGIIETYSCNKHIKMESRMTPLCLSYTVL